MFKRFFFRETRLIFFHFCFIVTYLSTLSIIFSERLPQAGEIGIPATMIGYFAREALSEPLNFEVSRLLFVIFGALWSFHIWVPLTSWLTALSYLFFSSMIFENSLGAERHSIHMVPMLFLTFALYYQFYWQELKQAANWKLRFSLQPKGPSWGFDLLVLAIGMSHSWAGISKVLESGFAWANGDSLRLWVYLWGLDNFLNQTILANQQFALFCQWAVLIVESTAVMALLFTRKRFFWACVLVFFHLVNQWMWGWNFLYWCPIILSCYASDLFDLLAKKVSSLRS